MSPHQTCEEIGLRYAGQFRNKAFVGQMIEEYTTAIQAASNEEMGRRRERMASLEAALKSLIEVCDDGDIGYVYDADSAACCQCTGTAKTMAEVIHDEGCIVPVVHRAKSALSGSTSALDAVASEAVKEKVLEVVNAGNRLLDFLSEHPKWFETKAQQAWDELSIEILKARV